MRKKIIKDEGALSKRNWDIRRKYARGMSMVSIAKQYGVTPMAICKVIHDTRKVL